MLVLGRKEGESLKLTVDGKVIMICVVAVQGSRVRIGVDADKSVHVIRNEIGDKSNE